MLVAPAPQSTPEPPQPAPSLPPQPRSSALDPAWAAAPTSLGALSAQGQPTHFQGGSLFLKPPLFTTFPASWAEEASRAVWPVEELLAGTPGPTWEA